MNRVLLDASKSRQAAGLRLKRQALRFLKYLKLSDVELSLSLVGDARIRSINRQWRAKDTATDVLSFPAGDHPGPGLRPLGDIVISVDTARRAAKAFETSFEHEMSLYLAHGLLHVLGHDHHVPAEARAMQRLERKLLGHDGMLSRSDEVG